MLMGVLPKADLNLSNEQILGKAYEISLTGFMTSKQNNQGTIINANLANKCINANILKDKVRGASVYGEIQLLSNIGYMVALSDKDSNPMAVRDHMNDINTKIGLYLSGIDSAAHPEVKKFLLGFTKNCIQKENIEGQDHYSLNPNIRSVEEMHAILNSVLPSKEMAEGAPGWAEKQNQIMLDIIEASKGLENPAREHFFAALRLADDPKKFVELVNTLDRNSEAFTSNLWRAALKGAIDPSEVNLALSKGVLASLKDIHALDKIGSTYDKENEIDRYHLIKHQVPKAELYDVISRIPESEKDPKSLIYKEFAQRQYGISFNSDFAFNKELVSLKTTMLANQEFQSIADDLRGARKKEDITKAIQKYELEYAEKGRKVFQDTQENILEVNNILSTITQGKDGKPLNVNDLQRMFANGINFDMAKAVKYKLGSKDIDLDEGAKEFLDSLRTTSVLANPKAISRLMTLLGDIDRSQKLLEENAQKYFAVVGDSDNTFKSKESHDIANKLYEIVVEGNLREFPKEKAAILTLSPKMQPSSFALLTSKLQTGPIASEAIDLITSNYKASYEPKIENYVDRAYQVCKLENKKDRSYALQWAMSNKVDPEKLDQIIGVCNNYKNIPAADIIKFSSRSKQLEKNLEILRSTCADPKLEAPLLKLCNSTGINPSHLAGMYGSSEGKKDISTILAHAYEAQPHLKPKEVGDLVAKLKLMNPVELANLAQKYEKRELYANIQVLNNVLGPGGNISLLETDPHGKRTPAGLKEQFSTDTVVDKINQLKLISANNKDQRVENTILLSEKQQLLEDFLAVNKFGEEHVRHLDRGQLQKLAQDYRDVLQNPEASPAEQKEAMLGYMAVARESMYRVSGKFANSTQMLAIMNNFSAGSHVVNEVQTGQGKSIISAISASVLSASGHSVDVCTSNMDLATRDIEENGKFFDYIGTKYSKTPISQTSTREQYSVGGINYSTIPDLSLYKQNMRFEYGDALPKTKTALVADEFDAAANMTTVMRLAKPKEMIDKATDSQYKVVYEAANEFVALHKEDCRTKTVGELVEMMQQAIKNNDQRAFGITNPADWDVFVKKMAKYVGADSVDGANTEKMGELLSAAYQASQLKEGKDFRVVTEEVQTKDGVVKISTAKVLANSLITDNVYSGGIHQCLHARLEKERTTGQSKSPYKFVINAESEVVSSQTVKNFIDSYDRLNGYTGTYGYDVELSGYSKDIQAFQVPKHQAHNRTDLEPQFAQGKDQHLDKINKFVDKLPGDVSSRQPILIVCENDEEARLMYEAISKKRPNDPIQMVDSVKQDIDPETRLAGQKGMITIATPRMSRGTDINPEHPNGLCVVTAYADFRRVEGQIQGRAGRQAAKGLTVQILDENDLRKKLQTSTGKPVTDKGKKLLKKYHQHLEQENLSSVQAKQLEGDLRQAYILLKQSDVLEQDKDAPEKVKVLHKKWNKEFSDKWKDLNAKHSGDTSKIKQELFDNNPKLAEKLEKVQAAKANRAMLSHQQELTKAQQSSAMLKPSDLGGADKSANLQSDILKKKAKSSPEQMTMEKSEIRQEYLEFWRQKVDKDTLRSLSPKERGALQPNDGNFELIKGKIIESLLEYRNDTSNSLSSNQKMAVTSLIKSLEDTKSIGELYSAVKKAQQDSVVSDIQNHSIFSSSKGGSYQKVLDGILDKIVATGGIKQDSRSVKQGIDEVVEQVSKISPKNKVLKDIKTLMSMKFDPEKEGVLVSGLIKKTLMANMKKYNSSDRALAENIINNIDRVDLGTTKIAKVEDKRKLPPPPRKSTSFGVI